MLQEREIAAFLEQSHISEKNLRRLRVLERSRDARLAELARIVSEVGLIAPYCRRRMRTLARERRDLLALMVRVGLVSALPSVEEADDPDIELLSAWDEWAGLRGREP
jgi:arginine/ornithine N-succinyltransferase beta subunit